MNRLGDSDVHTLGDTSALQLLLGLLMYEVFDERKKTYKNDIVYIYVTPNTSRVKFGPSIVFDLLKKFNIDYLKNNVLSVRPLCLSALHMIMTNE